MTRQGELRKILGEFGSRFDRAVDEGRIDTLMTEALSAIQALNGSLYIEPIKCLHWAEGTKERICADKINELIALTRVRKQEDEDEG